MKNRLNCPYCNNILPSNGTHYYKCINKHLYTNKQEYKFGIIKSYIPYLCIKENLLLEYETNLKSLPDLLKEYNITYIDTYFLLDYFNIRKRTIKESIQKISIKKYKKTCQEKYGVDNISQIESIKEKKRQTFIKHYGVDNIRKVKEYYIKLDAFMIEKYGKKRITNPEKVSIGNINYWNKLDNITYEKRSNIQKNIMLNKWKNISTEDKNIFKENCKKVWNEEKKATHKLIWENLTDDEKNLRLNKLHNNSISLLEIRISNILKDLNIEFSQQVSIKFKSVDFLLKNTNIIIEVQGDFWHANPNKYKKDDILKFPIHHTTAEIIWKKDEKKKIILEKAGYTIIYLWEYDIRKMDDEKLSEYVLFKLIEIYEKCNN